MKSTSLWAPVFLSVIWAIVAILIQNCEDIPACLLTSEFFTVLFAGQTLIWVICESYQQSKERTSRSRPHFIISRTIRVPRNDWKWTVENKGGHAKNVKLLHLNEEQTVFKKNSFAHFDSSRFEIRTGYNHSYEARFSSERSERYFQRWKIESGECTEITHGPEPLATEE